MLTACSAEDPRIRVCVAVVTCVNLLYAQPHGRTELTIQPGTQGEILVHISTPRPGDMIDVLTAGEEVRPTVVLPNGREVTVIN